MSYVALAGAVVGLGTSVYSGMQQKKAAAKAASASKGSFQPIVLPDMPKYIPVDLNNLQNTAVNYDTTAYGLSDRDFKRRHRPILQSEKLFEQGVLRDQQGDSELMPAIQNEYMRAGIGGALSAFGDTPGTLAPGSAGEASVARNLGLSITGFQDRNRANRERSLALAEQLFPRRTFGLTGADAAGVETANIAGLNAQNQAEYANQVQALQFNATGGANFANAQQNQLNVNAQGQALADAERNKAIISAGELIAKLGAGYAGTRSTTAAPTTYNTSAAAAAQAPYAAGVTKYPNMGYVPRAAAA